MNGTAPTRKPLEAVITEWRAIAATLRRTGHNHSAELIEMVLAEVTPAAEEYIHWLTEDRAQLRSGRSLNWLRHHFAGWQRAGHARLEGRKRLYRMVVIEQRGNALRAWDAGQAAADPREQARKDAAAAGARAVRIRSDPPPATSEENAPGPPLNAEGS